MLRIVRKARLKDKEMKVLLLGLDSAGKTTISKRLRGEPIDEVSPTKGFEISTKHVNEYKINIWDVGGQESIRSFWKNYFEKTDTLVWVVDATDRDPERIEACRRQLHDLLVEERLMGASLLVFKNKSDVVDGMTTAEVRQLLQLDDIDSHKWKIIDSSAVTGQGLDEGLRWIVDDAKERMFLY